MELMLLPFSHALLISCIIIIKQVSISKYKNLKPLARSSYQSNDVAYHSEGTSV